MFEFLGYLAEILLFGLEVKYPRTTLFITGVILLCIVIFLIFYFGFSGGGDVARSEVESVIKLIDKAIAEFYKDQFTLPADVDQLIDFAYVEKEKKVWDNWEFSLEGDANSITAIKAVSRDTDKYGETIRFDCVDKMFDD